MENYMKKNILILATVVTAAAGLLGCATAGSVSTAALTEPAPHAKPGFFTEERDGRLWVFPEGSDDLKAFQEKGPPVRQVRRISAGPQGQTLISTEAKYLDAYQVAKPGFFTEVRDGRLWVFPEGSDDHKAFLEKGPPVRQVRRISAGPMGMTIISTESEHIVDYLVSKPGFFTEVRDGRLWVFPEGSDDHKAFLEKGPPVRQVRRISAGPMGMTVISTEAEFIDAYLN
jgi:hypothetical protein